MYLNLTGVCTWFRSTCRIHPITVGWWMCFLKSKALSEAGADIHLHCFHHDRAEASELSRLCASVHYYPRHNYLPLTKPHIVGSRNSPQLLHNLLVRDSPILFEGLHTCFYLADERLKHRRKFVRMHNINRITTNIWRRTKKVGSGSYTLR